MPDDQLFAEDDFARQPPPLPHEAGWRKLFQSLPFGIVFLDASGRIIDANPAAEGILGLARAEMDGRESADPRWRATDSEGRPLPAEQHPAAVALRTGQEVRGVVMGVQHAGRGEQRWIQVDVIPQYHPGEDRPFQVYAVVQDVTEAKRTRDALRQTEARFQVALASPAVTLALCDLELRYTWIHNPHPDFDAEAAVGKRDDEIAPPEVARPWMEFKTRVLESGTPQREVIGVTLSTGRHHYEVLGHPIRGEDGAMKGLSTTSVDVTERAEAEQRASDESERRRVALEAAEVASVAKNQFLAVMSHELRTPLNAIVGFHELLVMELKGPVTGGQREYLDRIKEGAGHLLGIIDEILSLARVEAGTEQLLLERAEIGSLARRTAALLKPKADEKGLIFRIDLPVEPVEITTDVQKVRQIVLNLLSNALRFTDQGEVRLRVYEDDDGFICVEVHDTGVGIAPEHGDWIFEPFTQVDQSTTRRAGGTGLGLSIARRYAWLLGGDLKMRSELGNGSQFTLMLPCGQPEEQHGPPREGS